MIDLIQIITTALINVITGIVSNIFWIILVVWITKTLTKAIKSLIEKVPEWLDKYESIKSNQNAIQQARQYFNKVKA